MMEPVPTGAVPMLLLLLGGVTTGPIESGGGTSVRLLLGAVKEYEAGAVPDGRDVGGLVMFADVYGEGPDKDGAELLW